MFSLTSHGMYGIPDMVGSSPHALSPSDVVTLNVGTEVVITWEGGNGPHLYEIMDEGVHDIALALGHPCGVKISQILADAGYVSLPNATNHGGADAPPVH